MRWSILILLLSGCSMWQVPPLSDAPVMTPEQCRRQGVAVPDGANPTGTVVSWEFKWFHQLEPLCFRKKVDERPGAAPGRASLSVAGCTVPVEADQGSTAQISPSHRYRVYFADAYHLCIPMHEKCHGDYEIFRHTDEFTARAWGESDGFAACPAKRNSKGERL